MRVCILYRPSSEHSGLVDDYLRDFKARYDIELETLDIDSVDGINLSQLYDITSYPAILATADDGSLQQLWQSGSLPLMGEVYAFAKEG